MTGYVAGQGENRNNGLFGGDWGWIVLLLLFGWGGYGGGFGGFGGMGGAGLQGMATRADINAGFQFNDIQNGIRGIQQGICDSTYALNNAITGGFHNTTVGMMQGFNGVERNFCDISHQLAQCCYDNRAAIADLKYTIATEDCATRNLMQNNTRDIIDATNAGFRAVMDRLAQSDYNALREKYEDVRTQNLMLNQNNVTRAMFDAGVAEVVRRTGNDYPVPCYPVQPPTPLHFPINSCGQVQFGGYGNATGYGNGYAYAA